MDKVCYIYTMEIKQKWTSNTHTKDNSQKQKVKEAKNKKTYLYEILK